ncbi:MAG: DUF4373 domain-containing protein [Bacteroidetes bacterium]|nr:DUF4373 domain-containing protein [Bacteroidota bacterium]MCW5896698.1 DUF4373 domain-containing protein [Bacteroidota bacterium]
MKWFHHECAAKHDPKLQTLGDEFGAEGLGIYWGLLEEIGQHSDTFHLKVTGISRETDTNFDALTQTSGTLTQSSERLMINCFSSELDLKRIPQLSVRLLAKNLFTSPHKLIKVLDVLAKIGLFDSAKWLKYNVLYSPSFEQRADDYTRRLQRRSVSPDKVGKGTDNVRTNPALSGVEESKHSTNTVRTDSGQTSDIVLSKTDFVRPDTEQTMNRREEDQNSIHACMPDGYVDNSCYQNSAVEDSDFLIVPTSEQFEFYRQKLLSELVAWNDGRRNKFIWHPTPEELRKIFFSGSEQHKLTLCYQAYNLNHETINYPELVLRAVRLMLRSSERKRIQNPIGWLWSCLHGTGDGTTPWVQLLSADEEDSVSHYVRDLSRSRHPP